jgi:alanine dehydrogenase
VVIAAKHSSTGDSSCLVSEEMVKQMKPGAVIVDVSIDQGGCFETSKPTSHQHPVYKLHDITHYCVPNIASRVPHTASYSLSNFLTTLLLQMADSGSMEQFIFHDKGFAQGVYLYSGILTNKNIATKLGLTYRDLDLLMAAMR